MCYMLRYIISLDNQSTYFSPFQAFLSTTPHFITTPTLGIFLKATTLGCIIVYPSLFRFCRKVFEILPKFLSKIRHIFKNICPWSLKIAWLKLPNQKKHFKPYIYPCLVIFKNSDLRFSTPPFNTPPLLLYIREYLKCLIDKTERFIKRIHWKASLRWNIS